MATVFVVHEATISAAQYAESPEVREVVDLLRKREAVKTAGNGDFHFRVDRDTDIDQYALRYALPGHDELCWTALKALQKIVREGKVRLTRGSRYSSNESLCD